MQNSVKTGGKRNVRASAPQPSTAPSARPKKSKAARSGRAKQPKAPAHAAAQPTNGAAPHGESAPQGATTVADETWRDACPHWPIGDLGQPWMDVPDAMYPADACGAMALAYIKNHAGFLEVQCRVRERTGQDELGRSWSFRAGKLGAGMLIAWEVARRRLLHSLNEDMEPAEGFVLPLPGIGGTVLYSWPDLALEMALGLLENAGDLRAELQPKLGPFNRAVEFDEALVIAERTAHIQGIETDLCRHLGNVFDPTPNQREAQKRAALASGLLAGNLW